MGRKAPTPPPNRTATMPKVSRQKPKPPPAPPVKLFRVYSVEPDHEPSGVREWRGPYSTDTIGPEPLPSERRNEK